MNVEVTTFRQASLHVSFKELESLLCLPQNVKISVAHNEGGGVSLCLHSFTNERLPLHVGGISPKVELHSLPGGCTNVPVPLGNSVVHIDVNMGQAPSLLE